MGSEGSFGSLACVGFCVVTSEMMGNDGRWAGKLNSQLFRMVVRLFGASVLGYISHERTDFYRRFTGGFARKACSQGQPGRTVRCMRILQRPYLQGFTLSC